MKKCISCQKEIDDGAEFCPFCGAKQDETQAKKVFPITERAFCRVFRPSFFGGFQADNDALCGFIEAFLSLSRAMTDDEIAEINHGFDTLLNNAEREYQLKGKRNEVALDVEKRVQVESEEFRYDFLSDSIFDAMKRNVLGTNHFGNVWLFALLAALDGNYSADKRKFFRRMKNLLPVTREQFVKCIASANSNYDRNGYAISFFKVLSKSLEVNRYGNITYKDENGEERETSWDELLKQIPEDFDFYAVVENKTKALCELEYQIQELENSEGKYADIADKIAELARQERALLDALPGFVYQKF